MFLRNVLSAVAIVGLGQMASADPLPSWTEGEARARIVTFVENVSDPASDSFVPI